MSDYVFVCYSREDEAFVLKLATNLKNHGVPVWLDQWNIPSGANWNRTIERALNDCATQLVVLSPASVESDEVQSEWLAALEEKKVIVPILYQTCRMPFRLKPIQYIDFTSRSSDDISALNDVLIALGKTESTLSRPAEISVPKEKLSVPSSIESNLEEATFWYNKGNALYNQKKYDEAINAYDEAIRLDPNYTDAWYWKGIALYNQKKYDEAIKAYDEAIRLDPNYAAARYWKGIALEALGRTSEANAAFARAKVLGYEG